MGSSIPHWNERPKEWDALRVGIKGDLAPGIVRRISVKRAFDVDFKKGGGTDGETMTINGEKLARVTIVLELWTVTSLERLEKFLAVVMPKKPAKNPAPIDYVHPKLAYHGLKSLFLHDLDDSDHPGEGGTMKLTLQLANFRPAPKKPTGAGVSKTLASGTQSRAAPSSSRAEPASPGETDKSKFTGTLGKDWAKELGKTIGEEAATPPTPPRAAG